MYIEDYIQLKQTNNSSYPHQNNKLMLKTRARNVKMSLNRS